MGLPLRTGQQRRVEEFQQRHRVELMVLVFTDIVGSTQLKQQFGDEKAVLIIQEHHEALRSLLAQFPQADELETAGDSFLLVFGRPSDAVKFALRWQAQLRNWGGLSGKTLLDRIGIHVGEVFIQEKEQQAKVFGAQVDVCARVMTLARGDQILMTRFAFDNARSMLGGKDMEGVRPLSWANHGAYLLKGVAEPVEICEVGEIGCAVLKAPANSEKAHRHISADQEPVLGWRPALNQLVPNTKWTLEKKLGEGGFGEVWLGQHETLKERRVFKFCFRADRMRSLKREVTLFRLLKERVGQHPNIVGIQEVFFDQPPYYIVMDYAEGQDLRSWCAGQGGVARVPLETRLEIVAQVADALQAAHEAGVIHRDVKPSNILIEVRGRPASELATQASQNREPKAEMGGSQPSEQVLESEIRPFKASPCPAPLKVKLTDFGIGQVVSQEALGSMTRLGFTQTMLSPGSSAPLGTQLYMAPELLAGQTASARSDLYSLGVVLYQLLIEDLGRPLTTDWRKRINDPLLRSDLECCFAGDIDERFRSGRDLALHLRSLSQRNAELRQRERRARLVKLVSKGVLALAVLIAAVASVVAFQTNRRFLWQHEQSDAGATKSRDALDCFTRGQSLNYLNSSREDLKQAVGWFEKAIRFDPNFPQAYVELAYVCHQLESFWEPRMGWHGRAMRATETALRLSPQSAQAYVMRGLLDFTYDQHWDAVNAIRLERKALQIDPRVKKAHSNLAFVYGHIGLLQEAIEELNLEIGLDPLNQAPQWLKGVSLLEVGIAGHPERFTEALAVLEPLPDGAYRHPSVRGYKVGSCLTYLGRLEDAAQLINAYLSKQPEDPMLLSTLAIVQIKQRDSNAAQQSLAKAEAGARQDSIVFHHVAYNLGSAHALMGDLEQSLVWLKRAIDDGYPCYPVFLHDPNLDPIRAHPKFIAFLSELAQQHRRTLEAVLPAGKWLTRGWSAIGIAVVVIAGGSCVAVSRWVRRNRSRPSSSVP